MLRVYGAALDIEAVLARVPVLPESVLRAGEPKFRTKPDGEKIRISQVGYLVSGAEFVEFETQKHDAIQFLREYRGAISEALQAPGCEGATLDFGINRREVVVQTDYLPPELIAVAGDLGLGVELTQYPATDEEESEPGPAGGHSLRSCP